MVDGEARLQRVAFGKELRNSCLAAHALVLQALPELCNGAIRECGALNDVLKRSHPRIDLTQVRASL